MKFALLLLGAIVILSVVSARSLRKKRQSGVYLLPDGVELYLSAPLSSNFRCSDAGYYADIDNNCEIFHICDVQTTTEGIREVRQYSFACGNATMFNQMTLTCATPEESIPCSAAPQYYSINERLGREDIPFHTEEDLNELTRLTAARQQK